MFTYVFITIIWGVLTSLNGEGNGNPLQYSCLENPMDGGAWCPWGRKESDTTEQLHYLLKRTLSDILPSLKLSCQPLLRGWDGWIASLTQWTWVWVNSRSWWWTEKPGVLQSMGSQRVRHDWVTELNISFHICIYIPHLLKSIRWVFRLFSCLGYYK